MFELIKRHRILTWFCLFCVVLVFIGWAVRPDIAPQPRQQPEAAPVLQEPASGTQQTTTQISSPDPIADECEIPAQESAAASDGELSKESIGRIADFAEVNYAQSNNPDELVFYALLAEQDGQALSRFVDVIDSGSMSPYLVWKAVNRCLSRNGSGFACPRERWIELQKEIDGDNSEVWMRIAGLRFSQGDEAAGIAALERAANATRTDDYFARDLGVIVNGAEASGEVNRYGAARLAFGLAAGVLPAYEYHSYACLDPAISDAYRVRLCEQYASNIRNRATSDIVSETAKSIDLFALKTRGEVQQVEERETARQQALQARVNDVSNERARKQFERLNPDLLYAYLSDFGLYGEQEAQARRLRRLSEAGFEAFRERCSEQLASL